MTTGFGWIMKIVLLLIWPWGPDLRLAVSPAPPFFLSQNQPDFGQKGGETGDHVLTDSNKSNPPPPQKKKKKKNLKKATFMTLLPLEGSVDHHSLNAV